MADTDVLIASAGPIGLTAAIELARRGVDIRIIDPIHDPPQYAKTVGVQPRTLEVFEGMGVLRRILDAAIQMKGQIVHVNGERVAQVDFATPADIPFGFIAIPQYDTERILREELAMHGVQIERGLQVAGLYAGDEATADDVATFERAADAAVRTAHCRIDVYLIAAPNADVDITVLPLIRDRDGDFARMYSAVGPSVYVVRPDGYLGFASAGIDTDNLVTHLSSTFR